MTLSPFRAHLRQLAVVLALPALVCGATTAAAGTGNLPGTAGAGTISDVVEAPRPAFYEPPASIPAVGRVIRTQPATFLIDPLGLGSLSVDAKTVMYASTDRLDRPIAVTGTVFVPKTPWIGLSARPVISYAPGTQGMADRCAPSRGMAETLTSYEHYFILGLLQRGYAVALTDYQGLGTPGTHTYISRVAEGHAVLDMARAATHLPGLNAQSPVGIIGYSQGGGAAASAAELSSTYAPELNLKGTVAGAVPADLSAVAKNLEGGLYAAFLGYATLGLAAAHDLDPQTFLNASGLAKAKELEASCVLDLTKFSFLQSSTITKDGRPLTAYLSEEPFVSVLNENRIGNLKPAKPVLVSHSILDDVIPYAQGREMAVKWCTKGANVSFQPNAAPGHVGGTVPSAATSYAFFEARFAGLPQISNCGWF